MTQLKTLENQPFQLKNSPFCFKNIYAIDFFLNPYKHPSYLSFFLLCGMNLRNRLKHNQYRNHKDSLS
ncbi:MAG: hypothetical protein ACI959_001821 [Limisphaerales bacterium]|jgi:hypothetical protein